MAVTVRVLSRLTLKAAYLWIRGRIFRGKWIHLSWILQTQQVSSSTGGNFLQPAVIILLLWFLTLSLFLHLSFVRSNFPSPAHVSPSRLLSGVSAITSRCRRALLWQAALICICTTNTKLEICFLRGNVTLSVWIQSTKLTGGLRWDFQADDTDWRCERDTADNNLLQVSSHQQHFYSPTTSVALKLWCQPIRSDLQGTKRSFKIEYPPVWSGLFVWKAEKHVQNHNLNRF